MTDVYRWAVVKSDGTIIEPTIAPKKKQSEEAYREFATMGLPVARPVFRWYKDNCGVRVARFKLVECAEGEGE